jgi:hypothetical protein
MSWLYLPPSVKLQAWSIQVTLELAADVKRRVIIPARRFPMLLMWLVRSPPDRACDHRRRCASELMTLYPAGIDDVSTLKLRALFRAELQRAADDGLLDLAP